MNSFLRIAISIVCAAIAWFICSTIVGYLFILIGVEDARLLACISMGSFFIAIYFGLIVNTFLEDKFPSKETPKKLILENPYSINAPLVLHTENGDVSAFVSAEEDENGRIEIHTIDEMNGALIHLFTRDQLDKLTKRNQKVVEVMPMLKNGEPDFLKTTPERGYKFLYHETGLQPNEVHQIAVNNLSIAKENLNKILQQKPQPSTSVTNFIKEKKAWQDKADSARKVVDYWTAIIVIAMGRTH